MTVEKLFDKLKTGLGIGRTDLREQVVRIALDAQANGIHLDPSNFTSRDISTGAVWGLINDGYESGVVDKKDLKLLRMFVARNTQTVVR